MLIAVVFDNGTVGPLDASADLAVISPYAPKALDPHNRRDGLGTTHHETGTL